VPDFSDPSGRQSLFEADTTRGIKEQEERRDCSNWRARDLAEYAGQGQEVETTTTTCRQWQTKRKRQGPASKQGQEAISKEVDRNLTDRILTALTHRNENSHVHHMHLFFGYHFFI